MSHLIVPWASMSVEQVDQEYFRVIAQIADYAHEYVTAQQAYEDDRYSPGWTERATRAHLARAALWGACGFVQDSDSAVLGEQLPGITPK